MPSTLPKIQSPRKPGSPDTGRPKSRNAPAAAAGAKGARGSISVNKAAKERPTPVLTTAQANNIGRDEDKNRDEIERQEAIAYTALTLHRQDSTLSGTELARMRMSAAADRLSDNDAAHAARLEEVNAVVEKLNGQIDELAGRLTGHIDRGSSADTSRLHFLEKHAYHLEQALSDSNVHVEHLRAENEALRTTLNMRLIHANREMDELRTEVRAEVEQAALDFKTLLQQVHHRVDAAVLQYHKPQFESALTSLKEITKATQDTVDEHSARMHSVIDTIGARGVVVESKTMHSNVPVRYRAALRDFTPQQLLSLIDVLSFEDGVVDAIGRAVAAGGKRRTQAVFQS